MSNRVEFREALYQARIALDTWFPLVGDDRTWTDAVDSYSVRGKLANHGPGQAEDRSLHAAVNVILSKTHQSVDRGDIHNAS